SSVTSSRDAISPTVTDSGDLPSATTRTAMSRSVTMPTSFSPSTTGMIPTSSSRISRAASITVCPLSIERGLSVISSRMLRAIATPFARSQRSLPGELSGKCVTQTTNRAHVRAVCELQACRVGLRLARGGLPALAAGGLLLRGCPTLRRAAARARRVRRLAAAARRAGRVGDARGALLRHALVLQRLVLLLVLDVGALVRHRPLLRSTLRCVHEREPDIDRQPRAAPGRPVARGPLVGLGVLLGRPARGLRVRDRRLVQLVVPIVRTGVHILVFHHEGRPSRQFRA